MSSNTNEKQNMERFAKPLEMAQSSFMTLNRPLKEKWRE
jgi:hypothetical protein